MTEAPGPRVAATTTSFALIEALKERGEAGVTELAGEVDVSKSTAHTHLETLVDLGYVVRVEKQYRLGLQFLDLGDKARTRHDLYDASIQEMDELVETVGERGQVMVEENARGIYIYQVKADRAIQTDSHIGTTVDLHATAIGKAYLAFLPAAEQARVLDQLDFAPSTPNTVTDRDVLVDELELIKERGHAYNDEERIAGMRAVGAPIVSPTDETLGAISVSGPTTRMSGEWYREEVPETVKQAAQVIGIKATYS
jgi:DNA-binding IclR family transcriptional regulator